MNATETKAYNWLVKQGVKGLIFQGRRSPDFISEDGTGYEVKRLVGNTIVFTPGQLEEIKKIPNAQILVMDSTDEPIAIIPAHEITEVPSYWRNIRITGWKLDTKTIRIPKPLWRQLKIASAQHDIKIQDLVIAALESKLRDIEKR